MNYNKDLRWHLNRHLLHYDEFFIAPDCTSVVLGDDEWELTRSHITYYLRGKRTLTIPLNLISYDMMIRALS